jgi:NitT/TauT family transport system permease protein
MPAVAFIPLAIIWAGVGDAEKFMILFIGIFFQEVLLIMDNVKNVPRQLVNVAYTFGLKPWEILLRVVLPSALPGIVDTLRRAGPWLSHHAGGALLRYSLYHLRHPRYRSARPDH